jgi:hypothetical protein
MQTNRSAVLISGRVYHHEYRPLDHKYATYLAADYKANEADYKANEGYNARVIRLPRRIFKGKQGYHHAWMLTHGAQPSWVL